MGEIAANEGRHGRPSPFPESSNGRRVGLTPVALGLAAGLLAAAVVLGGGQGTPGDSLCQVLALALVALLAWQGGVPRAAWLLAGALLLVPLLQLLVLPEAIWAWPEARAELGAALAYAGADRPSRWSLVPVATERAAQWLLPSLALFLAVAAAGARQRRVLLAVLLGLAALSLLLGLAQRAGGPESALRFYSITNPTSSVGFFANRNHYASLLACVLPLALLCTGWFASAGSREGRARIGWAVAGAGLTVSLIIGIALSNSRAGLLLGMAAAAACLPVLLGLRSGRGGRRLLAATLGLGALLAVQFALVGVMQQLEQDPLQDSRLRYARATVDAADAHAPLGSGLGTFRDAFPPFEGLLAENQIINHAHDDALELWLDAGWLALPVLAGLVGLLAWTGWRLWRRPPAIAGFDLLLARAAWWGLAVVALHSLLDYPLRTTSLLAVVGVLAGCLATNAASRVR